MAIKIGLFGGTFDPIHEGHIHLALAFADRLGLDQVLLMPTSLPPHKLKAHMASPADRVEMCRLAALTDPRLRVSDLEIRREGASFTADTLEILSKQQPEAEWYLMVGADMFLTLNTWWRFADIADMAVLCAAPRGKADLEQLRDYAAVLEAEGARCRLEDIPVMDVSSTDIRARAAAGESLQGLVPQAVERYIAEKGLYRTAASSAYSDEQLIEIIRVRESTKRFHHSLCVAEEAERLARRYGADPAKARTAGIVHDILKDVGAEAQLQIFRDFGILLDAVEQQAPPLWHAHAGAVFLEKILGVTDPEILAAVRYHTTGRAGMSLLEKILYLADMTSADRDYPDVGEMRRRVDLSLDSALEYALMYTIGDRLKKHEAIHPDTLSAYNELMIRQKGG